MNPKSKSHIQDFENEPQIQIQDFENESEIPVLIPKIPGIADPWAG